MKVSYISDLHLDFHVKCETNEDKMFKKTREFIEKLIKTDDGGKEVIVIAGDLSHYNKQSIAALEVFNEHYELVLFVPGNHDYYLVSDRQSKKYEDDSINRLFELSSKFQYEESLNKVVMLDNDVINHNGVKFYGSTMWYNLDTIEQQRFYSSISNDSKLIKKVNHYDLHEDDIYNYKYTMDNIKPDVVITHVPLITVDSHIKNNNDSCYKCDVDVLAPITISGHVHEQKMYQVDGEKVYINAIGYPDEKNDLTIKSFNL